MKRIGVLLANGFEEIEAITLVDVLRRAHFEVQLIGVDELHPKGSHHIVVRADLPWEEAVGQPWDVLVLPGGMPGAAHLRDHDGVVELLRRQVGAGNDVVAICAAPIVLGRAGLLTGKRATCYPGFEDQLGGALASDARVCTDGLIVTSRGPGTAMELSLALVARYAGEDEADRLRSQMLVG